MAWHSNADAERDLAIALDLLFWQGHGPRAWDYTYRQVNLFTEIAQERLKECYGSAGNGAPPM